MSEYRSYFSFFYYDSVLHPYESLSKDSTFTHGQIFLREAERYNLMMYTAKLAPLDQDSIIKGLDSTAHYGDNLVRFLISKGFKVCVLNPIQTSFMHKNNMRKTKTDKVDTFAIAKTLMMQDSLRFFK